MSNRSRDIRRMLERIPVVTKTSTVSHQMNSSSSPAIGPMRIINRRQTQRSAGSGLEKQLSLGLRGCDSN